MSETASNIPFKRKKLEMLLQGLKLPDRYKNNFEQYPTDPHTASMIVFTAFLNGDISNRVVADLGCGNGILSYASALMGASHVYSIDSDVEMTSLATANCRNLSVSVMTGDVEAFENRVDTVVMNPPFGSVRKHSDLAFINKACYISRKIYSIHNQKAHDFVVELYASKGSIISETRLKLVIPRIYRHHEHDIAEIDAFLLEVKPD